MKRCLPKFSFSFHKALVACFQSDVLPYRGFKLLKLQQTVLAYWHRACFLAPAGATVPKLPVGDECLVEDFFCQVKEMQEEVSRVHGIRGDKKVESFAGPRTEPPAVLREGQAESLLVL